MAVKRAESNWPLESPDLLTSVKILLEAGHYERAAELLLDVERGRVPPSDPGNSDPLAQARSLYMGCCQAEIEAHWHSRALAEAKHRESAFRRELRRLIGLTVADREVTEGGFGHALGREVSIVPPGPIPPANHRQSILKRLLLRWLGIEHLAFTPNLGRDVSVDETGVRPPPVISDIPTSLSLDDHDGLEIENGRIRPTLSVYCLGPFKAYQNGAFIDNWSNGKSKCLLKYLTVHRRRSVHKEVLMDLFWPRSDVESARNSLNVAMYHLRQTFSKRDETVAYVLFADDCYLLNPELRIWTDCDAFLYHVKRARAFDREGKKSPAVQEYRAAESLYKGDFLDEDRYADWPTPFRRQYTEEYSRVLESLSDHYLEMADYDACTATSRKLLAVDTCNEEAHRKLMRCYSRHGKRHLALRQYLYCREVLARELDVEPGLSTRALYEQIRNLQPV